MRAAIYLRQSKDQTGEGAAVARQREDALKLAQIRDWTVVETFEDNDTSAAGRVPRPGFEAVMAMVERGEVEVVISWDMTWLTRNRRDHLRVIETGQRHKTVLAFCRGSDLDLSTPSGRGFADILAGMARMEIDQKSDRQKRANVQAAENGKRVSGRRPFGYDKTGMIIVDEEAGAIRQAYHDVLLGVPMTRIAADWNDAGLFTPQKTRDGQPSRWRPGTARDVLLNPRYAGLRGYGPRPEHGRRKVEVKGKAQWPAIVEEETWLAAVKLLTDPARGTGPKGGRALLTGIALCGVCGASVHAGGANLKHVRAGTRVYRCSGSYGHVGRSAKPVEEYVAEVVIERLSLPDAVELLSDDQKPDIEALRSERLDQLADDFAEGELTSSRLKRATAKLKAKVAEVESEMADSGRADILADMIKGDAAKVWEDAPIERQRKIIDILFVVRLMPPGRGRRNFDPETVIITQKL